METVVVVVILDAASSPADGLDFCADIRRRYPTTACELLTPSSAAALQQTCSDSEVSLLARLTSQERRVFDLIGRGLSNREIGDKLHLAERTVKNYTSRLLQKLGMQRRTQAAVLSARLTERQALRQVLRSI